MFSDNVVTDHFLDFTSQTTVIDLTYCYGIHLYVKWTLGEKIIFCCLDNKWYFNEAFPLYCVFFQKTSYFTREYNLMHLNTLLSTYVIKGQPYHKIQALC